MTVSSPRTWVESEPRRYGQIVAEKIQSEEGGIREGFSQKCEGSGPSGYEQVQTEIQLPTNLANHREIFPSRVSLEPKLAEA